MAPRISLYVLIIFLLSPFQAEAAAKRIVSLYPGHTDNIVALGGEKRLVAVSKNDDDDMLPGLPRFSAKSGAEEILVEAGPRPDARAAEQNPQPAACQARRREVVSLEPPRWMISPPIREPPR
ncbi:MAG: hypothetical protein ACLUEQ_01895 [Cloacibacillus evryensis]